MPHCLLHNHVTVHTQLLVWCLPLAWLTKRVDYTVQFVIPEIYYIAFQFPERFKISYLSRRERLNVILLDILINFRSSDSLEFLSGN